MMYLPTYGAYPISIATSLAIESITNTGEFKTNRGTPAVHNIESLWLNVRTLFRNVMGALDKQGRKFIKTSDVYELILNDIDYITSTLTEFNNNIEVVPYICTYKNCDFSDWVVKKPKTAVAFNERAMLDGVLNLMIDKKEVDGLLVFKDKLEGPSETTIITHIPYDLLSWKYFRDLTLLESHTGRLKKRSQWNSKLNTKQYQTIPFNRPMLAIFGDGTMFGGVDIKVRNRVIELSNKCNWNALTTLSKIKQDVQLNFEPMILDFINRVD